MKIPQVLLSATLCVLTTGFAAAQSQFSGSVPRVDATGHVEIEQQPSRLRMRIDLLAKASDLKTALKKVKLREADARKQLEAQGVEQDAITVGTPQVKEIQTDMQREIMQMMESQLVLSGRGTENNEQPEPVTVSVPLTAEWAIQTKTVDDTLVWARELETSIRQADLSGAKKATALSPEEQELMEESMAEYADFGYYGMEEQQPGEPLFLYVASFSEEQIETAMTHAFEKAKKQAGRTARAAGKQAGDLLQISSDLTASENYDPFMYDGYGYNDYSGMWESFGGTTVSDGAETTESVTANAEPAKIVVTVMASFALK